MTRYARVPLLSYRYTDHESQDELRQVEQKNEPDEDLDTKIDHTFARGDKDAEVLKQY